MSDFDFVSLPAEDLDNCPDPEVWKSEEEVQLEVTDVKFGTDKNGKPYMMPRFAIKSDEAEYKTFTKFFGIPNSAMSVTERQQAIRSLRYFYRAFGIDYSSGQVTAEMLVGATGWALLKVKGSPDDEYGEQNEVKRFIEQ